MKYLNLKKLAVFLMSVVLLLTAVGCGVNDVVFDEAKTDTEAVDSAEGAMPESEQENVSENVPEELTETEKEVLEYFKKICEQIPELKDVCDAGNLDYQIEALEYYEEFTKFSFHGHLFNSDDSVLSVPHAIYRELPNYIALYDMSKSGKSEFINLMKEYDGSIYFSLKSDMQQLFAEEHAWITHAEDMFGLTDTEFDKNELERMEEKWFAGKDYPTSYQYYRDFYNTFFAEN